MRTNGFVCSLLVLLSLSANVSAETKREMFQFAKISEGQARKAALSLVPAKSVVESVELERENGRLIWSYDIKPPAGTKIKEIQIDAVTGEVAGQHDESANAEAAEQAAEKH